LKGIRHFSIFVVLFIMISTLPFPLFGEENRPVDRGDGVLENAGDWLIDEGEDLQYEDKTIIVNGNITVNGTLTLTRCMLIMNTSYSTIWVNGTLNLDTTNITGNSSYYYFIVTGTIDFQDSNLFDIAGSASSPFIGGLQLLTNDVTMDGGSIQNTEFTGLYLNADVTLVNLSISNNEYNIVMNGSTSQFINCTIMFPGSVNIFMCNGSSPLIIEGDQAGEIKFDDEASSLSIGHLLHVHVAYENGTSIPDVKVMATSVGGDVLVAAVTDQSGWVRNLALPEESIYKSIPDKVYRPYRVSAEKFGLLVMKSVPFESETTVEMVLSGDHFGEDITRGDFNGDNRLDLAVGASGNTSGMETPGAVFIYLNEGDLEFRDLNEAMADLKIEGVRDTEFGSVLSSGDINGDGYDDLLVSAPKSSQNGENSGTVYFFLGAETPGWTDVGDAAFDIDGEPYSDLGKHLLTANLNRDGFADFIIGDNQHSSVYYSTPDPAGDFGGIAQFRMYATTVGQDDDTGQPISKVQKNDNVRYDVDPQEKLHITNFTVGDIRGGIEEVILRVQYITDQYFGYYEAERGYVYYRTGEDWHDSVRPLAPSQNWDKETTMTFDLFASGVDTLDQLLNFEIYFKSEEGKSGSDHYIHFDYIILDIVAKPLSANHTLMPGNLSSGDVNGDGFTDLIISDTTGQVVHFGGPVGLSPPLFLQFATFEGNHNRTRLNNGALTMAMIGGPLNGNFDNGWNNWTKTTSIRNKNDGHWEITTEEHGDWKVYNGPTASLGPEGGNDVEYRNYFRQYVLYL